MGLNISHKRHVNQFSQLHRHSSGDSQRMHSPFQHHSADTRFRQQGRCWQVGQQPLHLLVRLCTMLPISHARLWTAPVLTAWRIKGSAPVPHLVLLHIDIVRTNFSQLCSCYLHNANWPAPCKQRWKKIRTMAPTASRWEKPHLGIHSTNLSS